MLRGEGQVRAIQTAKALVEENQEIIHHGIHGWRRPDLSVHKPQAVRDRLS